MPTLIALAGWIAVLLSLDPLGGYPKSAQGPGLTFDETFNVSEGVRLAAGLRGVAMGVLSFEDVFSTREDLGPNPLFGTHLADHPPLGRLWLGLWHNLAKALFPPADHETPFVITCARSGSAAAFAGLLFTVGYVATFRYGRWAGLLSAASLILMPRVFGHSHLAALETFTGLTFTLAVVAVAFSWNRGQPPTWKTAGLTGIVFGLALLSKIQAILIPLPVAVWALLQWKRRAIVPLLIWGIAASLVFFIGWPWLWWNPLSHLQEYLGHTTERSVIYTWYLGERFADRAVPWHYSFVMFLTTVPIGLHILGVVGLVAGSRPAWKQGQERLFLLCVLFPLVVFAVPGVTVYDGTRLFLVVFPIWALFIGRGGQVIGEWLLQRWSKLAVSVGFACFLVLQAFGLIALWPCHLSYFNAVVGGVRGAERLGFETTYWGDSVTRNFLQAAVKSVPANSVVEVVPVMHRAQLEEMWNQSPILRRHGMRLVPYGSLSQPAEYVLVISRQSYLPQEFRDLPASVRPRVEMRRSGVQLAALYEWPLRTTR